MARRRSFAFWHGFGSVISLFGQRRAPLVFRKRASSVSEAIEGDLNSILGDIRRAAEQWRREMRELQDKAVPHGG